MAHYVTVVMDADTHDVIDVVDGDASPALGLYNASAPWPPAVAGEAAHRSTKTRARQRSPEAYDDVRRYLARSGFEPVPYVRVALSKEQLYEGESPQP